MRSRLAAAALTIALLLPACYRPAPPPPLDETLAITVLTNQARLVRSQALLQSAIARELGRQLGWQLGPAGSARLELLIAEEEIDVVASGELGIPERWRIRLRGDWRLRTARYGELDGDFSAEGFYNDRAEERRALETASRSAAREIAASLRHRLSRPAVTAEPAPEG